MARRRSPLLELLRAPLAEPLPFEEPGEVRTPLELDQRGELRLGGTFVCGLSSAALNLAIGHHKPLLDRVRAIGGRTMRPVELRALCARLEALAALTDTLPEPPR